MEAQMDSGISFLVEDKITAFLDAVLKVKKVDHKLSKVNPLVLL